MSKTNKDIKGSAGIRVNTFYTDTPLDIALRLLRHAVLGVDDAVNDLAAPTPLANTDVANPPNNAQTGRPRSQ